MCGVFAAVVDKADAQSVLETVLTGLKSLEYRGYDSAGIGWLEGDFQLVKTLGDVDTLRGSMPEKLPSSVQAIAHTRWATHGKPSVVNAHPMLGDRFIIIHNGILDNYKDYHSLCVAEGIHFASQTDTEVLLMMMERAARAHEEESIAWLPETLSSLSGQWSIVWMDKMHPGAVFAYSNGRPLVVAASDHATYISSDVTSIVPFSAVVAQVADNVLLKATAQGAFIYGDGGWLSVECSPHGLHKESQDKGHFAHYMLKEIYEQTEVMERQYSVYQELDAYMQPFLDSIAASRDIMIVACGSSYYAGCVARYAIEKYLNKPVRVDIASEFNERSPALSKDTCVIVISQSGETADTLIALSLVQAQGIKALALCNVMSSAIALQADHVLPLLAGVEVGVASTKAFCAQVFALLYVVQRLAQGAVHRKDVDALISLMAIQLQQTAKLEKIALDCIQYEHILYIARDHIVPIAFEGALKYKEITYIHAEAYAGGELKHGPLALIDKKHPTIALLEPMHRERMLANIEEIRARDGDVIIFEMTSDVNSDAALSWPDTVPLWLQPLAFVIPVQLFAYYSCVHLGNNVDRPRNLAKCVSVE